MLMSFPLHTVWDENLLVSEEGLGDQEMHTDEQNVSYPRLNNLHPNTTFVNCWHSSCSAYMSPNQQSLSPQLEEGI